MNEAILAALITGACAIIAQVVVSAKSTKDLFAELDKRSELSDSELKKDIAVIRTEITDLRADVAKHNGIVERTYILEKEVAINKEKIKALESARNG